MLAFKIFNQYLNLSRFIHPFLRQLAHTENFCCKQQQVHFIGIWLFHWSAQKSIYLWRIENLFNFVTDLLQLEKIGTETTYIVLKAYTWNADFAKVILIQSMIEIYKRRKAKVAITFIFHMQKHISVLMLHIIMICWDSFTLLIIRQSRREKLSVKWK